MSGPLPGAPSGGPPEKQGLRSGCLVALIVIGLILLVFGVCIVAINLSGGG